MRYVVEAHADIPTDVELRRKNGERGVLDRYHFERLHKGGITLQIMAVYVEERYVPWRCIDKTLSQTELFLQDIEESSHFFLIRDKKDLGEVGRDPERIGVILGVEGAQVIEPGVELLHLLFRLGVRLVGLTWSHRNALASGCYDIASGGGVTGLGREMLAEMRRLGIIADAAHMSPASVLDAVRYYDGPVIASHTAADAVYSSPRATTDEGIIEIARSGGVIGVAAFPRILSSARPSVKTAADHIDHIVKLVGAEHAGFGADFVDFFEDLILQGKMGKEWIVPEENRTVDLWSATDMPKLAEELRLRGYSDDAVTGVMGANFMRVFREVLPG